MNDIDFDGINRAALSAGHRFLATLVPGGKLRGSEYVVLNPRRDDTKPGSFKINFKTGAWADFATTDRGGDIISWLAYACGLSQGDAAREIADRLGTQLHKPNARLGAGADIRSSHLVVSPIYTGPSHNEPHPKPKRSFPVRTAPDQHGRPHFFVGGDAGPRVSSDEVCRHVYTRDGIPVRVKIKRKDGFVSWYRVADGDVEGWQSAKPADYAEIPFIGAVDPFDQELANDLIYWPEGEKDATSLGLAHLPAFTFGGTGDGLPEAAGEYIRGRHVVILADNDDPGRRHAEQKAALAFDVAASVRVVHFPDVPEKEDVSYWLSLGHSGEELEQLARQTSLWIPDRSSDRASGHQPPRWQARTFGANTLQHEKFPALTYLLPDLIPEGLCLLVSRPKLGKSWLALDIALATAAGRIVLGNLKPTTGEVLYLALEDGKRRLQRRLSKLLPSFNDTWPPGLTFATEWPRSDQGGLSDIEAWIRDCIEKHSHPRLIIIDTLAHFRKPAAGKNAYLEDYAALAELQKLAGRYNLSIVVVHHDRKASADDVFDTVSGTLGVTGAVDTIAIMRRDSGVVTLHVRGRDIEESEKALQFSKATCKWTILGEAAEIRRSDERARVLAALQEAGEPLSISEIISLARLANRNAADQLLHRMAGDGDVKRIKRGLYCLPGYAPENTSKKHKKVRSEPKPPQEQGDNTSGNLTHNLTQISQESDRRDSGKGPLPEYLTENESESKIGSKNTKLLKEQEDNGRSYDLTHLTQLSKGPPTGGLDGPLQENLAPFDADGGAA
jgi:AAA domain